MSIKTIEEMRSESINKIKKAYENNELGFQKGATHCAYYCKKTNSKCAIGVLLDMDKVEFTKKGNVVKPFGTNYGNIDSIFYTWGLNTFKGLSKEECTSLQNKHDDVVGINLMTFKRQSRKKAFENYLYSL